MNKNQIIDAKQVSFCFESTENGKGLKCVLRELKEDTVEIQELKQLAAIKHDDIIEDLIASTASVQGGNHAHRLNITVQTLAECSPQDLYESRLCLQAANLFSEGMRYLNRANQADLLCHSEFYMKSAIKLLRLHNETVEALNRYRRRGEQKIVVQHNVMADKAIVNFPGGGGNTKNEGDTPCSTNYAEPRPEPTVIDLVASQPWPTEDADCTVEKVLVPELKSGNKK